MKTKSILTAITLSAFLLTQTSCNFLQNCEEGIGEVVTKTLPIKKFSKLEISDNVKVFLNQSNEQKVIIKGQQNLIDLLKTEISGNEWDIEFSRCIKAEERIEIYIDVAELSDINIDGSGDISSKTVFSNDILELSINGSGSMDLILAVKELKSDISGSGDITLQGNTKLHEIEINGSGDVSAYDLISDDTEVEINGSGDVKVNVSYALEVDINGSGDVYYKGEVKDMKSNINGSGKLHQAN